MADWATMAAAYEEADQAGDLATYRRRRWEYADDPASWLQPTTLPTLSQAQADSLYRAAGGRRNSAFRGNPIEEIRDAIDFLLYDTIKLENRFEECALDTAGFGLVGAGREWPSYLLTLREPTLFAPWSPHTERALRRLGLLPPGLKRGHPGLGYIDLLDALQPLSGRLGLRDFRAVDEFCYLIGRNARAQA